MDERLTLLITTYILAVSIVVRLIAQSGIKLPTTNLEWARTKTQSDGKLIFGIPFVKHRYGCAVTFPAGTVDFNFGEHGEINGFDLARLIGFAENDLDDYGFNNEEEVKTEFEAAEKAGQILYSGNILYYLPYSISEKDGFEWLKFMCQNR